MRTLSTAGREAWRAALRACALALFLSLGALPALAQERTQILATTEDGFGRIVIAFPNRLDLPPYRVKYENGVLAVEFDQQIVALLPDIAVALPDFVTVARVDPDGRGLRIGLRTAFNINRMEAAEKLFIDLMPVGWQGLPPGLPPEIVADLADRAKRAAELAEQQRKAEEAKTLHPVAAVRVGRNPTFVRVQFDWSTDTEAAFALDGTQASIDFDWPVAVDLYPLKSDLPEEIADVTNTVSTMGSRIDLSLGEGVKPRFYALSPRQFVLDIDISPEAGLKTALALEDAARQARENLRAAAAAENEAAPGADGDAGGEGQGLSPATQGVVVPVVSTVGDTVRITFPFDRDTPAAAYRRGDAVWMIFDTARAIQAPAPHEALAAVARNIAVLPAGDTKVVRIDLATDRLATLGSEGRAWVLSLGDVLLNPTEPVALQRRRNSEGEYEMAAQLDRAGKVHQLRDPVAGDTLSVVTALPPARGMARNLQYVDFDALRSAHGLVLRPRTDDLTVSIAANEVMITADGGLTLSAVETARTLDAGNAPAFRESYIDLGVWREDDPAMFTDRREQIISRAADSEGRLRETARLDLAQFYIANGFSYEAIGVLGVLQSELQSEDLRKKVRLTRAIADTLAGRPAEAIKVLAASPFAEESDALLWRALARIDAGDYRGARLDVIAAEGIADSYPTWVRTRFLLAGIRAAVETRDEPLALRLIGKVEFAVLDPEQVSLYQLMQARIAELENHVDEALDIYGQVIASDVRPTRAEAVYRTLLLLDASGRIDLAKATETLSAEVLLWRGGRLEADMQKLLAELYFRHHEYRDGFLAVKQAAANFPESLSINELLIDAQREFEELFLNGAADGLGDIEALSLYYDFRQLTPAGARGDEMIRNLARRLVKVDLLTQAADLLEYQIDSRLNGVAQAQVAADLAVIRLADRDPEGALRVLNRTRLADLSPQLERQRRILEARALIDAGRQEFAVDLISRLTGRDADMLRVDGYWKAKNYATAAELLESMYSPGPDTPRLNQTGRMNVVKAAVGFVLAGDKIGLSRLRSKFGDVMARSAEWPLFEFVTRDIVPQSIEFRKVAREVSGLDSLEAFLATYRETYTEGDPLTPARPRKPDSA